MDSDWTEVRGPDGLTFGERIIQLRKRLGLSQTALAERVTGVARPNTVGAWESGKSVPLADKALRLAEVLDVTVQHLLTGEGPIHAAAPDMEAEGFREIAAVVDRVRSALDALGAADSGDGPGESGGQQAGGGGAA